MQNCKIYGGLYQWHTALGLQDSCDTIARTIGTCGSSGRIQGICPAGWHLPSDSEFEILSNFLGGDSISALKMMSNQMGGTNSSGFNVLAAGRLNYGESSIYDVIGHATSFWTTTYNGSADGWLYDLIDSNSEFILDYNDHRYGLSIRCLKN